MITFGLSDRYTWLQEDYPREDGAARRPLPYDDEDLSRKPALPGARAGELRSGAASVDAAVARSRHWS